MGTYHFIIIWSFRLNPVMMDTAQHLGESYSSNRTLIPKVIWSHSEGMKWKNHLDYSQVSNQRSVASPSPHGVAGMTILSINAMKLSRQDQSDTLITRLSGIKCTPHPGKSQMMMLKWSIRKCSTSDNNGVTKADCRTHSGYGLGSSQRARRTVRWFIRRSLWPMRFTSWEVRNSTISFTPMHYWYWGMLEAYVDSCSSRKTSRIFHWSRQWGTCFIAFSLSIVSLC